PSRCKRLHGCFAPGSRRLHAPLRSKPIEYIPSRVYPAHTPVIKFGTDVRVALAVDFITGKSSHMRAQLAAIQNVLLIFDLNVFFSRFDYGTVRVGPRQTFVQIG